MVDGAFGEMVDGGPDYDGGTKIRVVVKSGWYQNQGGSKIRVVPKSGWYQNQGGTKIRVVPNSGIEIPSTRIHG